MRFCNHCSRLYTGDICPCQQGKTRKYHHDAFYGTKHWIRISKYVKARDYEQDRLVMFLLRPDLFFAYETTLNANVYNLLHNVLIDAYGNARYISDRLIVHHIVPKEEDKNLQYDLDNLITVSNHAHEYLHQLYNGQYKKYVQDILTAAVHTTLP